MSTLEIQGLRKCYDGRPAVAELSFVAESGQILGVIGPNGAGKSTTFLSLSGLLRPDAGTIVLDGTRLAENRGRTIALIPETPEVVPLLTVWEHMVYVAKLNRLGPQWIARANELLERLGLTAERDRLGHTLSKGLRQKTLIAATVLIESPVILLDEPMIGLDPRAQRELRDLLFELRGAGKIVILSTHMLSIAENLCDRIIILQAGSKVAEGTIDELHERHSASLEELFFEITDDSALSR